MRQRFVVTYDISDAVRLRKVFKLMKGYGRHLQYSVFACDLNELGLAELKGDLLAVIDPGEDQVLIIDLGPSEGRGREVVESLGRAYTERERLAIVS